MGAGTRHLYISMRARVERMADSPGRPAALLSALLRRRMRSEYAAGLPGENARSVDEQCTATSDRIAELHCSIARLRTYVPGAVKNEAVFRQRQAVIREHERALCGLVQLDSMLQLVSSDVRRTQHDCRVRAGGALPRPHRRRALREPTLPRQSSTIIRFQIAQTTDSLLRYMLGSRCAETTLHEREPQPDRFHPTCCAATDFPLFQILRLLTAVCFYRDIYIGRVTAVPGSPPKHVLALRDLLCTLAVIPTLTFRVDARRKRHLKHLCDKLANLAHQYYNSGVDFGALEEIMTENVWLMHLRLCDVV